MQWAVANGVAHSSCTTRSIDPQNSISDLAEGEYARERYNRICRTGAGRNWRAASEREFKFRFWVFGGIFWLSVLLYMFDPENTGFALGHAIAKLLHCAPGGPDGRGACSGLAYQRLFR